MRLIIYSSIILLPLAAALGINCRGSGACPLAGFENDASEGVLEGLRDALHSATESDSTTYNSGDHIICVSTKIGITIGVGITRVLSLSASTTVDFEVGGICAFGQDLQTPLSLAQIRPLVDALLDHGCKVCGSIPVHFVDEGSNDPSQGILTFNYVSNDLCVGNCLGHPLGDGGTAVRSAGGQNTVTVTTIPAAYSTASVAESAAGGQNIITVTNTPAAGSSTSATTVTVQDTTTSALEPSSTSTAAATVTVRIGSAVREAASDLASIGLLLSQLVLAVL